MKSPNFLLKRLFLFLGIYLSCLALFYTSGLKEKTADLYRSQASWFFASFANGGIVEFNKDVTADKRFDTTVILISEQQKAKAIQKAKKAGLTQIKIKRTKFPMNTWNFAILPFLFFIALVLTSPIRWKDKLIALVLGLLGIYLFVLFKQWWSLLLKYSENYNRFEVGINSEIGFKCINYFYNIIAFPFFGLMFAIVLWIFLCMEKIHISQGTSTQTQLV